MKRFSKILALLTVLILAVLQLNVLSVSAAVRDTSDDIGWVQVDGDWYYYEDEEYILADGWLTLDSGLYYLDEDGVMQTGWLESAGFWYYLGNDGAAKTGWQQIGGDWYYFSSAGAMATGWFEIGGREYYFGADGVMWTGWINTVDGKWYYLSGSGALVTGWQQIGGKWYCFDSTGAMQTGWVQSGGKWYYLDGSGAMKTGWVQTGGKWYYLDGSGAMKTGWLQLGNKWYYLNSSGVMQTGTIQVDGKKYVLDSNGVWQSGISGGTTSSSGSQTNKNGTSSAILPDLKDFYKLDRSYSDSDYMKGGNYKKFIQLPLSALETVRKETLALLQEDCYQLELVGERDYGAGVSYFFRYTGTNPDVKLLEKGEYKFNLRLDFEPKESGVFLCTILYSDAFDIVDSGKQVSADLSSANSSGSSSGGGTTGGNGTYIPDASKLRCTSCGGDGDCNTCGGDGYLYSSASGKEDRNCYSCTRGRCSTCNGTGWRYN